LGWRTAGGASVPNMASAERSFERGEFLNPSSVHPKVSILKVAPLFAQALERVLTAAAVAAARRVATFEFGIIGSTARWQRLTESPAVEEPHG
jgi:hypothetical protein